MNCGGFYIHHLTNYSYVDEDSELWQNGRIIFRLVQIALTFDKNSVCYHPQFELVCLEHCTRQNTFTCADTDSDDDQKIK